MYKRIAFVIGLPVLVGSLLLLRSYYPETDNPRELPQVSVQSSDSISVEIEPLESEAVSENLSETIASFPVELVRFRNYEVLETRVLDRNSGVWKRRHFAHSKKERFTSIIVDEDVAEDSDTGVFRVARQGAYLADEILLELDVAESNWPQLESALEPLGLRVFRKSRLSNLIQLKFAPDSIEAFDLAFRLLEERFPEAHVSKNYLYHTSLVPDDWRSDAMWNIDHVGAVDAWEFSVGSADVVVGILDTGMVLDHPDLAGNLYVNLGEIPDNGIDDDGNGFIDDVNGWDFFDDDNDPTDDVGHGTHVSGTIGAVGDNRKGNTGINWDVGLLPLKVGDAESIPSSAIYNALSYVEMMKQNGVNIVATNNSYGGSNFEFTFRNRIRDQEDAGILFVAAAGNNGEDLDGEGSQYPAGYDEANIISVANSTQGDRLDASSNYGFVSVDLAAPGKGVYSTYTNDDYEELTGTSMASPLVAGAIALLASSEPELEWSELRSRIFDTVTKLPSLNGGVATGGRLNVLGALKPELQDFHLDVSNHPGQVILLPDASMSVILELDVSAYDEIEFDGDGGSIEVVDENTVMASFPGDGSYFIEIEISRFGVERSIRKLVVVGELEDVSEGMIHYWDFEGEGVNESDKASSEVGTLVNVNRVETPFGKGVEFPGSDSRMEFDADYSSRVTISAFVNADHIDASFHPRIIETPHHYIYFSSYDEFKRNNVSPIDDGNWDTFKFLSKRQGSKNPNAVWNSPPESVEEDEWMHVVATYDGRRNDNIPSMYINGKEQVVRAQALASTGPLTSGGDSYIGDREDWERAWDGQMDEIRLYDRELSQKEITRLTAGFVRNGFAGYSVEGSNQGVAGLAVSFEVLDGAAQAPDEVLEWSILTDEENYEILDSSGNTLTLRFLVEGTYEILASAANSFGSKYFSKNVEILLPVVGYESYQILERKTVWSNESGLRRKTLIRDQDRLLGYIVLDEEMVYDEGTGELVLVDQAICSADELIFELDTERIDEAILDAKLEEWGLEIGRRSKLSDDVTLRLSADITIERIDSVFADLSSTFSNVEIEENHIYLADDVPNDWNEATLWHLDQIGAQDAWAIETGSEEVVIAIIDTGAMMDHPDLQDSLYVNTGEIPDNGLDDDNNGFIDDWRGWDFANSDNDPEDTVGHGTHVSGIVGATGNNEIGYTGVNWNVKLMILKVGEDDGLANFAINEALRYVEMMKERGVNIVATNNSYGSSSSSFFTRREIQDQQDLGILFVAAAGNDGNDLDNTILHYPASYTEDIIISVANSTQADDLSSSSSYGVTSVDLAAPGKDVYSTYNDGGYRELSGTSMASPMVAGAIGLLAASEPELGWAEMRTRLFDTATPVPALDGKVATGGRLNLLAALNPDLSGFHLEVVSHPGEVILVETPGIPLKFELDASEYDSIEIEEIDALEGVSIDIVDSDTAVARFASDGVYGIEFRIQRLGIERTVRKFVVVGELNDVRDGLLHQWSFEGDGTIVEDQVGTADGELFGAALSEGPLGKAVEFLGGVGRMNFNGTFSPQVTLTAFARSDPSSVTHPRVFDMPHHFMYYSQFLGDSSAPDGNRDTFKFLSNRTTGDAGVWNTPPNSFRNSEWQHLAATYDGSSIDNIPSMYINAKQQVVRAQSVPSGPQKESDGNSFLGNSSLVNRAWNGLMDEVRVYNRELSAKEIAILAGRYVEETWAEYSIVGPRELVVGSQLSLAFGDSNGVAPNAQVSWEIIDATSGFEILGIEGNEINIQFDEQGTYNVVLGVSDDYGSQYFLARIDVHGPGALPGVYGGSFEGDGVVWIEVESSGESGYVSLFDPSSELLRYRDPIVVDDQNGFLVALSESVTIQGTIDGAFGGTVSGLDLSFSGVPLDLTDGANGLSGLYRGAVLNEAGSSVFAQVLDDGETLFSFSGFSVDSAQGTVGENGQFAFDSVNGDRIEGVVMGNGDGIAGNIVREGGSQDFFLSLDSDPSTSRYVNLSTRGRTVAESRALSGGFVIEGTVSRRMLIRGVGPGLEAFSIQNALSDPTLSIFSGSTAIVSNNDWGLAENASEIEIVSAEVGAFGLGDGSLDAAALVTLSPGIYSAQVRSNVDGETGTVMVEIYDTSSQEAGGLLNVSTRGFVSGNETKLPAGFVISGDSPKRVFIRAAGPALSDFGIVNSLPDPKVEIISNGVSFAENDNWSDGLVTEFGDDLLQGPPVEIELANEQVGAFAFAPSSKDAALIVWLNPGVYTATVSGVGGSSGIVLVEVYGLE